MVDRLYPFEDINYILICIIMLKILHILRLKRVKFTYTPEMHVHPCTLQSICLEEVVVLMKKGFALLISLFLVLSYALTPLGASASSWKSVKTVHPPKSVIHYGGVKYAKKKLMYPKTVTVKLSNGQSTHRSVKWSKVSFDKKKLGYKQKITGDVSGTSKHAYWYVTVKNYPVKFTAPKLMTVGKNQSVSLPKQLSVTLADGKRTAYPLKWSKVSTASLGQKKLTYSASATNVVLSGSAKLTVSDVIQSGQKYAVVADGKKIQATGKILYPAKGMNHYLVIVNKSTGKSMKVHFKLDKNGSYSVMSGELAPGSYSVYILSGSKKSKAVTITIKKPVTEPTDEQKRQLLKELLLVIQVSNPLLSDINLPKVDGVSFEIDSNNAAVSSKGMVTRGMNDQVVSFTINAMLDGVKEGRSFSNILVPRQSLSDEALIDFTLQNFNITSPLTMDIILPTADGISFSLVSSNEAVVSSKGIVKRGLEDKRVDLTLRAVKGNIVKTKSFPDILVPKVTNANELILQDYLDKLDIKSPVLKNIVLPPLSGATVSLTSLKPSIISETGLVTRGLTDQTVSLVVTVSKDGVSKSRDFWNLVVPKRDDATDMLLQDYLDGLSINNPLTKDLALTPPDGATLSISSSDSAVVSSAGKVTRGLTDKTVSITISVSKDGVTKSRVFSNIKIPKLDNATDMLLQDYLDGLTINNPLTKDLALTPPDGATLSISSSDSAVVSSAGKVTRGLTDKTVSITISVSKDGVTKSRVFSNIKIPLSESAELDAALNAINLGSLLNLTGNITLPIISNGISVQWSSNKPDVISNTGVVKGSLALQTFVLTATVSKNGVTKTKDFNGSVSADLGLPFKEDLTKIKSTVGTLHLISDLNLPSTLNGSAITWTSGNTSLLGNNGKILSRNQSTPFTLTAQTAGTTETLNVSIQNPSGDLLSNLLDLLGNVLNPVVTSLTGGQTSATLPKEYGGLLFLGKKDITNWTSSHPDLVTIQGYNVTVQPDEREHLVVLYAKYEDITNPVPVLVKIPAKK